MSSKLPRTADAVIVGAGIVGACCAHYLAAEGLRVLVLDRGWVSNGTTSAGEGNILVSDKNPGPELDLALLSMALWEDLGDKLGPGAELERKGGVVVASSESQYNALLLRARRQRMAGVEVAALDAHQLHSCEPQVSPRLTGACLYPQDMQIQPMLATAMLLAAPSRPGRIAFVGNCEVKSIETDLAGLVKTVKTALGQVATPVVVNAAGTWAGDLARMAGVAVPILPRRGFILVTEPLPQVIRHKVYSADYVANVSSDNEGLETSTVIESTRGGPILIGSSRERVGLDRMVDWSILATIASKAIAVFPFLAPMRVLRTYLGFRPYCPDHLPIIGPDPRSPGLFHACGHEGAGVGLAPATGALVAQSVVGRSSTLPLYPFRADRFDR
jgi:glycine/D-amino acid oxidase-like deaminating enzyme